MTVPPKEVSVDPRQALSVSMEQYSTQWAQALSPHYASPQPAAERTQEQAQALGQLSPNDQAMFAKIREQLPAHISDDMALHATLQAKRAGIETPDALAAITARGDRLFMMGIIPGDRTIVDLAQQAPPVQETTQQVQEHNQQRQLQIAESMQRGLDDQGRGGPAMR